MKSTVLHSLHTEAGAKMVPFAGWEMPLYYSAGATEEHRMVRRSAGLFDVSHMGRFEIRGRESEAFLNRLISSGVPSLKPGQSGYGLLLKEDGTVLDDVFLYHLEQESWILVVNASNLEKDWKWLQDHTAGYDMTLRDASEETALLALQGPKVIGCLGRIQGEDLTGWERFGVRELQLGGVNCLAGRTGYTGEDGVEIFVHKDRACELWSLLLERCGETCDILPCGLAARDSLRFEPGFPLYGHELDETVLPPEALLKWACDLSTDFIGKDAVQALLDRGLSRKLVTFRLTDKGVPREGYEILSPEGEVIGSVVSGMYAPTLDQYCGNGYVPLKFTKAGTELGISVRGRVKKAEVMKRPLYRPSYR